MFDSRFPGGGDALRELAIDSVRRALNEAGRPTGAGDPLPAELVDVAAHYDLPVSTLVGFIHFTPAGSAITAESFARHCRTYRGGDGDTQAIMDAGDGELCQQCHAHPVMRIGGFWVCASGRCAPRVVAG